MTLVIERGGVGHVDEMMRLMDSFDPAWGEAWTRAQCQGLFGLPGTELFLARVDGASAGFALSRTILDDAELLLLAVSPSFRRRGVGRALIERVSASAADGGAHRIHLEVRDGNGARGLYDRSGFAAAGRRRDYYRHSGGETADAITLIRAISSG